MRILAPLLTLALLSGCVSTRVDEGAVSVAPATHVHDGALRGLDTRGAPLLRIEPGGSLVDSSGVGVAGEHLAGAVERVGLEAVAAGRYATEVGLEVLDHVTEREGAATRAMLDDQIQGFRDDVSTALWAPETGVLHQLAAQNAQLSATVAQLEATVKAVETEARLGREDIGGSFRLIGYSAVILCVLLGSAVVIWVHGGREGGK